MDQSDPVPPSDSSASKRVWPYKSAADAQKAGERFADRNLKGFQRTEILERLRATGPMAASAAGHLIDNIHKQDMTTRHEILSLLESLLKKDADLSPYADNLAKFLGDTNHALRTRVAETMTLMGPQAMPAMPRILGILRHSRADMRMLGAHILGGIGPACARQAKDKLEAQLGNPGNTPDLTQAIAEALEKITGKVPAKVTNAGETTSISPAPQQAPTETQAPPLNSPFTHLTGGRILVVDDTAQMRNLLASALRRFGASVAEAPDGARGLAMLQMAAKQNTPFDVIALDLMMPVMNGVEMLKRVREDETIALTQCVIVSAKGDRQLVAAVAQYGISGYVLKPYRLPELLKKLDELVCESRTGHASTHS